VQGDKDPCEEELVLLFQRKRETIDDGAQNLEKFSNAVEPLSFVDELEKDVVDGATYVRAEVEELSVDSMQGSLEEVALSRVFRVEQLQQLPYVSCLDKG
jgi:hypothetical protein